MTTTREILEALAEGKITVKEAEEKIKFMALAEVGNIGMIDLSRETRSGVPEVVFAESKSVHSLIKIVEVMITNKSVALLTRMNQHKLAAVEEAFGNHVFESSGTEEHLTVLIHSKDWIESPKEGKIAIMTAGTSDIAFACEAEAIARLMGVETLTFYDIGVAGMHRLIEPVKKVIEEGVDVLVVFAGMEGALPTVLASLSDIPVIGVPIPTGYGYGGEGETALASMLQSCAPGLAVVNIGNGLGAGAIACLIAKRCARKSD
ncbi:MAG: nickel pincer cofactor biosynthesis protein LarB [Candidatus Thorarchaeota archaeon]